MARNVLTELRGKTSMACLSQKWLGSCQGVAALTLILLVVATGSAQAVDPFGDFTMHICETEMCLMNPAAAADLVLSDRTLMIFRDSPYIELRNDSNSSAPITEFHLTIGDPRFNFSYNVFLGSKTLGYQFTSRTVGGLGDELVVNIENGGLAKGAAIHFKIDLGVDAAFKNLIKEGDRPDYRDIFGHGGESIAKAIFDPETGDNFIKQHVYQFEEVSGSTAGSTRRQRPGVDPVRMYAGVDVSSVPEPTSALLFVCGLVGSLTVSTRSRRIRKAA